MHCNTSVYTVVPVSILQYQCMHCNTSVCTAIPVSTLQYQCLHGSTSFYTAIPVYALQYQCLHCNTSLYTAIPVTKKRLRSFLYSAVSSLLDRSKRFTLFASLADLFILTPIPLLREAFLPGSNYVPRLNHSHFHHCLISVFSQVLIYTAESAVSTLQYQCLHCNASVYTAIPVSTLQ